MAAESSRLQNELQNLKDRFRIGQDEYLRTNKGQTLDALLIEAGRKDIESAEAVHRLLLKKQFVPQTTETVIYNARYGVDCSTEPNGNPSRRLSLLGNPIGAEWFLRLCQEAMQIVSVRVEGVDTRALSIGMCNWNRAAKEKLRWTPAERKTDIRFDTRHAALCRWLWIMFDVAWRADVGTTLCACRWLAHPKCEAALPYEIEIFQGRCREPRPANFIKAELQWAKKMPDYFHSRIDDVFAKSISMIDLMMLNIDDPFKSKPRDDSPTSVDPDKLQLAFEFIRTQGPKIGKEVAVHIVVKPPSFRRHYVKPLKALGVCNVPGKGYFVP